jgi:hypothetical protein
MPYERQRALRQELNARFPRIKGDIDQQVFRSGWYDGRMAGLPHAEAREQSLAAVRRLNPHFTPVEHAL